MADALQPVEAEATYQGIPCLSAEFAATPGGSPNTGTVVVAARSMTALRIQVGRALFSDRPFPSVSTIPRNPPLDFPVGAMELGDGVVENGTLQPFGELVLRSTVGEVKVQRLMPIDVEPIDQDDDGMVLYRIRLADVRTIWPHRGVLFGDFNHYQADGSPVPHVPQRRLSFTLKWCGAALPGVAKLELAPKAAEVAKKTELRGISWRFDRPDVKLEDQLKTQDLHQVLQPDGETIRVYARGEGKDSPKALGVPAKLMRAVAAPSMTLVPDSVLVVGAPRQEERIVALGPDAMVGLPLGSDTLTPWTEALKTYGLKPADAARWITQKPEKQAYILGLGPNVGQALHYLNDQIDAMRGLIAEARKEKLHPAVIAQLIDTLSAFLGDTARVTVDAVGGDVSQQSLETLNAAIKNVQAAVAQAQSDGVNQKVIDQIFDTLNALYEETGRVAAEVSARAVERGKVLAERLRSWLYRWFRLPANLNHTLPMMDPINATTKETEPIGIWTDVWTEFPDLTATTRRRWGTVTGATVDPREVQIDRDQGVIRVNTKEPPGVVLSPLVETIEQGRLGPPSLRVYYRHEVKDGRIRAGEAATDSPNATSPADHFTFALERTGAQVKKVPLDHLQSTPRVVKNPDLVVLERTNGSSNEQDVRRIAFEQAAAHFGAPSVVQTWTIDAVGIHPVWPDGAVGQVSFRVNDRQATTKVVINSYRLSAGMAPTYSQKRVLETVARNAAASEPVIAAAVSSRRTGR